MAKRLGLDLQNAKGGLDKLKHRLLFAIGALIAFHIGPSVSIPGIDAAVLAKLLEQQRGTVIEMSSMFSGGALNRASIFTLGIMSYISAPIIIQLLTVVHPTLVKIKKEEESDRRKIGQYTRYGTLALAIFQSVGIAAGLSNMSGMRGLVISPGLAFCFITVVSLVTGTTFLMWLGEQIIERGINNGVSIIIFAGVVVGFPPVITHTIEQARQGDLHSLVLLSVVVLVFAVTFLVIFVERGQCRIVVNYAKHQQGYCVYAAQSTHLPLKVNTAGVIPTIFAPSIILFPATIASRFEGGTGWNWLTTISLYLQSGQPLYVLLYASTIIFFYSFYTALVFNPHKTVDNLKRSGALVPGIHPGEQTARHIDKIITRLTLVGALYITFICLIPKFMCDVMKVPPYLGGTSPSIVVVATMGFTAQVQTLMMSNQYKSTLKKMNLEGYDR